MSWQNLAQEIRREFPALTQKVHGHDLVYLDSGATTLKPQSVIDAITRHYSFETANVHRGIHWLSAEGTRKYEATRESIAKLINAKTEREVVFTKGTTDALNLLAHGFSKTILKAGDEILLSTMEHHSNIVPWQLAAEQVGAKVVEVPVTDRGEIDLVAYKKLLNSKTKIVSITHVSNTLGTINPIKEMATLAHQHGAFFVVDAAQSIAHTIVDVQELGVDFIAFSGHKMFGPTGVGILWGRAELLEALPPYQGGGAMIKQVTFQKTTYNDVPERFEAGTPAIAEVIALKDAVDFIKRIGFETIHKIEEGLLSEATRVLTSIDGIRLIGQSENKASVISFVIEGSHPHDVGMILDQQGVAIRTGHHCTQPLMARFGVPATCRASFSIYNTEQDIERLQQSLLKAKELL
jgi:cysteine desulfurase/selenocysteine lyase